MEQMQLGPAGQLEISPTRYAKAVKILLKMSITDCGYLETGIRLRKLKECVCVWGGD
jgi:hypothetical protein